MSDLAKNAFFRQLSVPLNNPQWSWGASDGDYMVLQVWEDELVKRENLRRWTPLLGPRARYAPGDRHGLDERYRHVRALWEGGVAGYAIRALAKNTASIPRETDSFRDDGVFMLEQLEFVNDEVLALLGDFVSLRELTRHRAVHRTRGGDGAFPLTWSTGPIAPKALAPQLPQAQSPLTKTESTSDSDETNADEELLRREARFTLVEIRPMQSAFRLSVFRECKGRCVVSGCDIPEALEAAHLRGRSWRDGDNRGQDGVLLRRDLHALYDRGLLDLDDAGGFLFSESVLAYYGALAPMP